MSIDKNKALVRRVFEEMWHKGNLDFAEEVFTSDYIQHGMGGPEEIHGPEGYKQNVATIRSAFPDFHVEIKDQIAEGDRVVTRYATSGTHRGEFMGVAPTGKRIETTAVGIDRFSGGKIVESWEQYDALGMLQQLGLIPSSGE